MDCLEPQTTSHLTESHSFPGNSSVHVLPQGHPPSGYGIQTVVTAVGVSPSTGSLSNVFNFSELQFPHLFMGLVIVSIFRGAVRTKRLRHEVHLKDGLGDSVLWTSLSYYPCFLSFHTSISGHGDLARVG